MDEIGGSLPRFPMLDSIPAEAREISRQIWALLGPLVAGDSTVHDRFANCPCHNGFESWRRVAEPINDDKILILKDLPPAGTNPRPAKSIEDLSTALGGLENKPEAVHHSWRQASTPGAAEVEFYLPLAPRCECLCVYAHGLAGVRLLR